MTAKIYMTLMIIGLSLTPVSVIAGPCDAYFSFDGNLANASGSGGRMVGPDGAPAQAEFVAGKAGLALRLDGASAMRALIDLHPDACPQVTISAWINVPVAATEGYVVSTASQHGPALRVFGTSLELVGSNYGIVRRDVLYPDTWTFVALIYDSPNGQYHLHWGSRSLDKSMGEVRFFPGPAIWVGAYDQRLKYAPKGILVDELRIVGGALDEAQIAALRNAGGNAVAGTAGPAPAGGAACSAPGTCPQGAYCAADRTCHPLSHLPMQRQGGSPGPGNSPDGAMSSNGHRAAGIDYQADPDLLTGDGGLQGSGSGAGPGPVPPSDKTREALEAAVAESRAPELAYESEEAALEAQRRREAAPASDGFGGANAEPNSYSIGFVADVLRITGVAGDSGDYSERIVFTEKQQLLQGLDTIETNDKPCHVRVFSAGYAALRGSGPGPADAFEHISSYTRGMHEIDACEEGLPGWRLGNPDTEVGDTKFAGPITAVQVCTNKLNRRVKGIRVRIRDVSDPPDSTYAGSYRTAVLLERTNCLGWGDWVACPANTYAIGAQLHFRDGSLKVVSERDFLSGVALVCSGVDWVEAKLKGGL